MLLEVEYEGQPPAGAQRIIHAGKMHNDDVPLTEVFGATADLGMPATRMSGERKVWRAIGQAKRLEAASRSARRH